jgi:ssDNA-binding Zn-finger/Zn-ribbon topoisomerase 1
MNGRVNNLDPFDTEEIIEESKPTNVDENGAINKVTSVVKCPGCGANMIYSPKEKMLFCEFCETKKEIGASASQEIGLGALMNQNASWGEETHVFTCENCGAKEVFSKNEFARSCSFCGAGHVVETQDLVGLKPNAVVPFEITADTACENVKKWVKKKLFAPSAFKKSVKPQGIKGVYNPAFSFDTATHTSYSGVLGEYYYVTRRVNGKSVRERRVRYKRISGTFDHFFDDVLIQASTKITQKDIDKMQPFGTNDSKEYDEAFLSGFSASMYENDGMTCWERAKQVIQDNIKRMILSRYSYDFVQSFDYSTDCADITYKYLLLPVYVGHCNFKKKLYNFFVNGRNGKVAGKTPVSALKVALTVLLGIGIAVALFFLIQHFGG